MIFMNLIRLRMPGQKKQILLAAHVMKPLLSGWAIWAMSVPVLTEVMR
jgi:hypothetical protein